MKSKTVKETAQVGRTMTLLALPNWLVALFYLGSYVVLDFVSFIFPLSPVGVTPWNPQTGLSFALILLWGRAYLPLLFVAPALANVLPCHKASLVPDRTVSRRRSRRVRPPTASAAPWPGLRPTTGSPLNS